MNNKLKRQLSISIKSEESEILDKLMNNGVSIISIFRRGLMDFREEYLAELTQNNVA